MLAREPARVFADLLPKVGAQGCKEVVPGPTTKPNHGARLVSHQACADECVPLLIARQMMTNEQVPALRAVGEEAPQRASRCQAIGRCADRTELVAGPVTEEPEHPHPV